MKRLVRNLGILLCVLVMSCLSFGFKKEDFSILNFKSYNREFESTDMGLGLLSSTKTYEDYRLLNMVRSAQYQYIHNYCTVDDTGLLVDEEGFVGVAMGHAFGAIGSRYYVVLDTGNVIPVVKVDAKSSKHVPNGVSAGPKSSVIEFVIDVNKAKNYFGKGVNGLISSGNFNNHECFKGRIVSIEKVSDTRLEEGVIYEEKINNNLEDVQLEQDGFIDVRGGY